MCYSWGGNGNGVPASAGCNPTLPGGPYLAQLRVLDLYWTFLDKSPAVLADAHALEKLTISMPRPSKGDMACLIGLPCLRTVYIDVEAYTPNSVKFLLGLQRDCRDVHIISRLESELPGFGADALSDANAGYESKGVEF